MKERHRPWTEDLKTKPGISARMYLALSQKFSGAGKDYTLVWLLLALNVGIRCFVAARPLEYIDGLTIPDDAYLSLTIAKHIAQGLGPLYGLEYTNGFQPLYVFLMVPAFIFFPHDLIMPVRIALFLSIVIDSATLFLLYRYVKAFTTTILAPCLVSVAWIANPYFINTTLNGLETSLSLFFVVATLYYFHTISTDRDAVPTIRQCSFLGLLLGLACVTRIDNGFLALSVVVILLWQLRKSSFSVLSGRIVSIFATTALVVLPWLLYSYYYTGDVYPVSGRAVRFLCLGGDVHYHPTLQNLYIPMMQETMEALAKKNWVTIGVLGLTTLLLARHRVAVGKQILHVCQILAPALLFSMMLVCAYTFYILTPWFFPRYFYPVAVVLLLALGAWADVLFQSVRNTKSPALYAAIFVTLIVGLHTTHKHFRELLFSTDKTSLGYMNLGLWAKKEFPDGTTIGAPQSGALGYFADNLSVINLDGVVNKSCFESLVQHKAMEYIRRTGIQYVIGWKSNFTQIIENSPGLQPTDLLPVKTIDGFSTLRRAWVVMKVNYEATQ